MVRTLNQSELRCQRLRENFARLADLLLDEAAVLLRVAEVVQPEQVDAHRELSRVLGRLNDKSMEVIGDLLALLPPHTRRELGDVRLDRPR
jgi:hypothetical protein